MKKLALLIVTLSLLSTYSCKKEDYQLGPAPTEADAAFTYAASSESDNIIVFTASNPDIVAKWNFGNGSLGEGKTARGIYPEAGTYTAVLTVFTKGGSASTSQDIVIAEDDLSLLDDPLFNILTGGIDIGSKTWVVDSNYAGHFGVGPNPSDPAFGDFPNYYEAAANEKAGGGMYDDKYIFSLEGFKFDMITHGDVYINSEQANNFPGSFEASVGDYTAPYENQLGKSWTLTQGDENILTLSSGAFIGYNTGVNSYKIVSIEENEIFLRQLDAANGELAWYIRLVAEGYDSGGGGGNDTTGNGGGGGGGDTTDMYTLPIDFETVDPVFTVFGNSTYSIIDNPDASGINTSTRVLETVHGNETWAGLFVDLIDPLDFSTETTITFKIWAPVTGTVRVKLEEQSNQNSAVEKDVNVTTVNEWVELSVDFSGEAATFDRLVLFPGWGVGDPDTYYLDDIDQQ